MYAQTSWRPLIAWVALSALAHSHDSLASRQAADSACSQISAAITSASGVYYPLSLNYAFGNEHYMSSSSQNSACVVEVGSDRDTAIVMGIIASLRVPFGVKSGGHASNPGFSSTPGVQISLTRLNTISLSQDNQTITLGTGNIWTDVYSTLDGTGYNVVGGRVVGPGVGGFTLGGGYSWLTNQYGLTCDTVQQFTLILPNGTITTVGPKKRDLFFALKGGLNRFGIVTQIIFKAVPQPPLIYGGYQLFSNDKIPALINATAQFQAENTDPKAQVILTINGGLLNDAILLSFYDGPNPPAIFDSYSAISAEFSDVSTRSFSNFAQAAPSEVQSGKRGAFHSMSTSGLTVAFMEACNAEAQYYTKLSPLNLFSYDIEPFDASYGQYATDSAFPHASSPRPLNLYFAWTFETEDTYWRAQMAASVKRLTAVAKAEGIYDPALSVYPNYALARTSLKKMYGANLARLKAIKAAVDPDGVMDLTGGFNI